jgi:imidazolonepropionase
VPAARRVLEAARDRGLGLKIHAEQLSRLGGAVLAAELGAQSADHLEHASAQDLEALAAAGVVGVLLPGASFFLGTEHYAPMAEVRASGIEVALATDCNPGTCMTESMASILLLAVVKLKLSPGEALRAACLGGARALGLDGQIGSLEPDKQTDLAIFDVPDLEHLIYHFGVNHVRGVLKRGLPAFLRDEAPTASGLA